MRAPRPAGRSARPSRPVRSGLAAAVTVPLVGAVACQAPLGGYNPASHAIWWVGGAIFLVLAVILAVETWDWLRLAWRRLRRLDPPPGPVRPGDTFHLREDVRPLRRRHLWRPRAVRRTWGEGRTEADPDARR